MVGWEESDLKIALGSALTHRHQEYMFPLFDGFELNQSDVDFVSGNTTSNTAEAMTLTLRWIAGRMNAAYRKEFMVEISAMRKAVDAANDMAKAADARSAHAEAQSAQTEKQSRRDFWIGFGLSAAAIIISIVAIAQGA